MRKNIVELAAEVSARLSGKQAELFAQLLELVLSLAPDMAEFAKLEKVIKDQNIFVELAVKASEGIYPNHQGGHFIPADGQERVAALKVAASRKCSATKDSVIEVLTERAKQVSKFCPINDKQYTAAELVWAAMYYACPDVNSELPEALFEYTGWDRKHAKRTGDHRKNVVIAAALLLAELDRIDAAAKEPNLCMQRGETVSAVDGQSPFNAGKAPGEFTSQVAAKEAKARRTLGVGLSEAQRNMGKMANFIQAYYAGEPGADATLADFQAVAQRVADNAMRQFMPPAMGSWRAYGVYPSGVRTCTLGEYCRQDGASVSNTPSVKEGVSCRKTVGNGDCAYNIMLPYYVRTCGDADVAPEPKTVNIDKCLLREVLDLWEQGIKTTSVCCGHGKLVHRHISVMPESVDKMLALGYRPQRFMADRQGASFFPQTLAVFHLDINKGFNWWSEQPLNKEATAEPADKHGETAQGRKCTITPQKGYKVLLQVSEIDKVLLERNLVLRVDWADNTWKVFREGIAGELPVTSGTINGENNAIVIYADTSVLPTATTLK